MSPITSPEQQQPDGHSGSLMREIARYLEAVDLFRDLGCEPTWECDEPHAGAVVGLIAPYVDRMSPV